MPDWVGDEEVWKKAKSEVDRSNYNSDEEYWKVVAHVYKKMGGRVKRDGFSDTMKQGLGGTIVGGLLGVPMVGAGLGILHANKDRVNKMGKNLDMSFDKNDGSMFGWKKGGKGRNKTDKCRNPKKKNKSAMDDPASYLFK